MGAHRPGEGGEVGEFVFAEGHGEKSSRLHDKRGKAMRFNPLPGTGEPSGDVHAAAPFRGSGTVPPEVKASRSFVVELG